MGSANVKIYVDSSRGQDQGSGRSDQPLKTLTQALRRASANTRIQLQPGRYTTATGEQFPLRIPAEVVVMGNESTKGQDVRIEGGGSLTSQVFGQQIATIALVGNAELRGVTVTNPLTKGSGVWIESAAPAIAHCTFINCRREGIFVVGTAHPLIHDCIFQTNAASGIFLARQAKGEIRHNRFQNTGYGIAISDQAAPLILDNHVLDNRSGIVVSRTARPVLRDNFIANSQGDGLTVLNSALVDMGDAQEPGRNVFSNNGQFDLRNLTLTPLIVSGNQINPTKTSGEVSYVASIIPPPPPRAQGEPAPPPVFVPPAQPPVTSQRSPFSDIRGHWSQRFIEALAEREIIRGFPDGSARPEAQLTRAEYAVLLTKAFPLSPRKISQGFRDVEPSFWAASAIHNAERMGLLAGFPDGTFRPQAPLTRLQVLLSLVNGLGLRGGNTDSLTIYRDRVQIPSYAVGPVAIATQQRLVVNYPDPRRLDPNRPANRAETAAMLYQGLVATGRAAAISSPYILLPSPASASFSDIQSHWAAPFVQGMASQNYLGGFPDGSFKPDAAMNRAQYAVLLAKTFNPPPKRPAIRFSDVSASLWAAAAIQQVYQGGFLSGFGDNTFQPQQDISRLHLLLSLANALELPAADSQVLDIYGDRDSIPSSVRGAIASATVAGLVVNHPDPQRLELLRGATRGEVAAMVYQALVYRRQAQAIASAWISQPPNREGAEAIAQASTRMGAGRMVRMATGTKLPVSRPLSPTVVLVIYPAMDEGETQPELPQERQAIEAIAQLLKDELDQQGLQIHLMGQGHRVTPSAVKDRAHQVQATLVLFLSLIPTDQPAAHLQMVTRYSQLGGASSEATSAPLAQILQRSLIERTDLVDGGVQASDSTADQPGSFPAAHLVLTVDPQQPTLLRWQTYRQSLALAIAQGILTYVQQHYSVIDDTFRLAPP